MIKKILLRMVKMLFTTYLVITITFFMIYSLPNNIAIEELDDSLKEQIIKTYKLDEPIKNQYVNYLKNIYNLDLGSSIKYHDRKVSSIIKESFPVSFDLGVKVLIISIFISFPLSIYSIINRKLNKIIDNMILISVSFPVFVIIGFIQLYVVNIHNFIVIKYLKMDFLKLYLSGYNGFSRQILPILSLLVFQVSITTKIIRRKIKDEMKKPYVRFAISKGFDIKYVINKHIIKNIYITILSVITPYIISLITGSFIVESLFGLPGLGKYFTSSIIERDYTMILGLTIFYTVILNIVYFIIDILIILLDKNIRSDVNGKI